ncbi:class I SAM-dependent methyltransferase [Shewanella sp. JM162201]|uniref:Class I SAM-dependent methyltransferase n=1 Tax=Shewanella jiangmenensis TaxID=2837387 RepID=A0ABS5V5J6_9GAMM|nr:class I SAM-dependent methyltransferase [Shewanella jiangmenensis]MBT1445735.1 class I SAM-dependent methyltransferase [Shewanella jiangmenensis]
MQGFIDFLATASLTEDCQRLFHGRGGRVAGAEHLCLDWFEPALLLTSFKELDEASVAALRDAITAFWHRCQREQNTPDAPLNLVYQYRSGAGTRTELLCGALPETHIISEMGLKFQVHLLRGQNHGLFLDMREGRRFVREQASGKKVLNLFSYTCGFSVAALAGGAASVVNIDMAKGALAIGRQNHHLNAVASGAQFLGHDIFNSWGKLSRMGPYELVIADPPSNQKGSFIATKDYVRLLRRLPELVAPGGDVLLCLNAPELGSEFLLSQVAETAPTLEFIGRVANPPVYADIDEEKSLKVLHFRKTETAQERN